VRKKYQTSEAVQREARAKKTRGKNEEQRRDWRGRDELVCCTKNILDTADLRSENRKSDEGGKNNGLTAKQNTHTILNFPFKEEARRKKIFGKPTMNENIAKIPKNTVQIIEYGTIPLLSTPESGLSLNVSYTY